MSDLEPFPGLIEKQRLDPDRISGGDQARLTIGAERDTVVTFQDEVAAFENVLGGYLIEPDGTIRDPELLFERIEHADPLPGFPTALSTSDRHSDRVGSVRAELAGLGRFGRLGAALAAALLAALFAAPYGATAASPDSSPQQATSSVFEQGPCPETPSPVDVLATAWCGSLIVPENRAIPNGPSVRLPVVIIPAQSSTPAPDPIVYMSGGPGEDPILNLDIIAASGLNADRDLIVMSQRGTYLSTPRLTCPEIDRFRARMVSLVYDARSTGRGLAGATRRCHNRLLATGVDLSAYNTVENAADFADLRAALEIDQWNVYGASYGTELALIYVRLHPEGIRTVTLDGIVPNDAITPGAFWLSAQEGFNSLFRACAAEPSCESRYPQIGSTFERLVRELEADPIRTRVMVNGQPRTVVLDGGTLVNWFVRIESNVEDGKLIPHALDALANGNPKPIAKQWASLWTDPQFFGLFSYGLSFGVVCTEWVPFQDAAASLAMARQAFPGFPDSILRQTPQLPFLRESCGVWDLPAAPPSVRDVTTSQIPALIVSGGFDSKTGAQWGDFIAPRFPNATVITIPGMGHGAVIFSPCAQDVARSFFNRPNAPDTSCVAEIEPAPFK